MKINRDTIGDTLRKAHNAIKNGDEIEYIFLSVELDQKLRRLVRPSPLRERCRYKYAA